MGSFPRSSLGRLVVVIVSVTGLFACRPGDESATEGATQAGNLSVITVNYPLSYFSERIGGDAVEVNFPAPSDEDPVFWTPNAATIRAYQEADVILLNGASYAKWAARATLPQGKLVDTSSGFRDRYIAVADAVTHSHGPEGEHSHTGTAFTTWLDLRLAIEHANSIQDEFAQLRPTESVRFEKGFASLKNDLLELDGKLDQVFSQVGDDPVLGSHPVYQYLMRRYGLNLKSVYFEPDAAPSDAQWVKLRALLVTHPAKRMLWEAKPLPETASKLTALGVESIVFSPCGNRPASGDFLSVMRANLKNVQLAFMD